MSFRDVTPDEDRMIKAFMARLSETPVNMRLAAGAPEMIWLKAQLLRRWEAEQRAAVPLDVIEPLQAVALLATTLFLLLWSVPLLMRAVIP
jgi:hypothetical protein